MLFSLCFQVIHLWYHVEANWVWDLVNLTLKMVQLGATGGPATDATVDYPPW